MGGNIHKIPIAEAIKFFSSMTVYSGKRLFEEQVAWAPIEIREFLLRVNKF